MNKTLKSIVMILTLICLNMNLGFAEETKTDNELSDMGFEYIEVDGQKVPVGKNVSLDDATKYVEEKGYQLIGAIQKIAKPITLVVMVGCGLMAVISGLGGGANKGGGSGSWMWAAVVSALCYTGIVFSPLILNLIVNFMQP